MDSNITINIVEPASPTPTPVDPGTGTIVPDTGLFTHGIGGAEAAIIATISLVVILAIVGAIIYYCKHKQGKVSNIFAKCKQTLKTKKYASGLAVLALLASIGTVAGLLRLGASAVDDGLTVSSSSEELTIELADEPVFAVLPVELTVAEATEAGYTLTAYAESTGLVSTTNSSDIIPMVTIEDNELVALADNTYGLALIEPESQEDEVYAALSTDADTPTLITDKDYQATEENDTTTIYYGFYITPDVPYGTYEGSNINYQANPNYVTTLSFNGNGSDGGVDMEGMTIFAGDTITLPQNTYTRKGYSFTGWNTIATPTTEDPGVSYADEAEFTASLTESENITLYAQWKALPVIGDLTEMQDFAKLSAEDKASVLASMTSGQQYTLKDNRDQTMYYIAKLADGNVWMTQNLDLDLSTSTELTPDNTNITSNWTPANNTISMQGTSVPGWEHSSTVPYSADPGALFIYSSGNTDGDEQYTSLADCQAVHPDCSMHNHAGNYYNWSAAVASNNTEGITEQYTNVDSDICPAGWELPNGPQNSTNLFENNEFNALIVSQDGIAGDRPSYCGGLCSFYNYADGGFNKIRTAPLWLTRSGCVSNGSLDSTGSSGRYWSSTVLGSDGAFDLFFSSGNVGPAYGNGRYDGYSVRCVAQ